MAMSIAAAAPRWMKLASPGQRTRNVEVGMSMGAFLEELA
jgi:hypothetical protein